MFFYCFSRQQALEIERLRAAKIAALPPSVDPVQVQFMFNLSQKYLSKVLTKSKF